MNLTTLLIICLTSFTTLFAASAVYSDVDTVIKQCDKCHGSNGQSTRKEYPIIAGLSNVYIEDTLFAYQEKRRPDIGLSYPGSISSDKEPGKIAIIARLSEQDIEAIAGHYAKLLFTPAKQNYDASIAAQGKKIHDELCEKCHSAAGSNPADDAGILAGQWSDYLRNSFTRFAKNQREQPKAMAKKLQTLTNNEIEALIHFYASLSK